MTCTERLRRQITFLLESERLKGVLRRVSPIGSARYENSAEHSWTLVLMAMVLREHANEQLDLLRVMQMLAVHDLVEIDAGDTFCYDIAENATKEEREACAADRLFDLLEDDQALHFRSLWEEFEARATTEAKFANALDRLMPLLQNFHNQGGSWREFQIGKDQAMERMRPISDGSATLSTFAQSILREAELLKLFG